MSKNSIGQIGFYQAVEAFKTHREEISNKCRNKRDLANFILEKTGLRITDNNINGIFKICDIKSENLFKRHRPNPNKQNTHDMRVLTKTMYNLYKSLGAEIPQSLQLLYERKVLMIDNNK